MRDVMCFILSVTLLAALVFAGSLPGEAVLPPGRSAGWWGLLFPGLFGLDGTEERVVFDWPLLRWLFPAPRANA